MKDNNLKGHIEALKTNSSCIEEQIEKAVVLMIELGEYFSRNPFDSEEEKEIVLETHYNTGVKCSIIADILNDVAERLLAVEYRTDELLRLTQEGADAE